jgi:hypothetical protein
MSRVWVKFSDASGTYYLDPAWKSVENFAGISPIDVASNMGYNSGSFFNDASDGITEGQSYVTKINDNKIQTNMKLYSESLARKITETYPTLKPSEILGTDKIINDAYFLTEKKHNRLEF